ncbi:MAG: zf-HC2 domain-containing protein [Firmicutes bacterium]|nr:zf-HC2 domain-containing protein [Bacillota bacterium]
MDGFTINCGACRDLLPLYAEGMASDESVALTEAHLNTCESCRVELEHIRENPTPAQLPFKRSMRRAKRNLKRKKTVIAICASLGASVVLFGLFLFLINYMIPVKTPPDDLKFSVADGVFMATSETDSLFTNSRLSFHKAQDGSDIFVVILSMQNPIGRKILPAMTRIVYPPLEGLTGVKWHPEHGMHCRINLYEGLSYDEDECLIDPGYNLSGKGLWRVYFIQEQDYQKRFIKVDETTGKLMAESMQYATLVWEETIG